MCVEGDKMRVCMCEFDESFDLSSVGKKVCVRVWVSESVCLCVREREKKRIVCHQCLLFCSVKIGFVL